MSIDVRFWCLKTIPTLKGLSKPSLFSSTYNVKTHWHGNSKKVVYFSFLKNQNSLLQHLFLKPLLSHDPVQRPDAVDILDSKLMKEADKVIFERCRATSKSRSRTMSSSSSTSSLWIYNISLFEFYWLPFVLYKYIFIVFHSFQRIFIKCMSVYTIIFHCHNGLTGKTSLDIFPVLNAT